MMEIYWTAHAREQLRSIYDYIADDSPLYASRVVDRLTRRSQQIAAFPYSGRSVPEFESSEIREVLEGPYRLIYRITSEQIDIISVLYGAQEPPENP
jgi:addiction module RelE/StbE family toxin